MEALRRLLIRIRWVCNEGLPITVSREDLLVAAPIVAHRTEQGSQLLQAIRAAREVMIHDGAPATRILLNLLQTAFTLIRELTETITWLENIRRLLLSMEVEIKLGAPI